MTTRARRVPPRVGQWGEWGIIDFIRRTQVTSTPSTRRMVRVGIGDDAAVIAPPARGRKSIVSTDLLIEDVHFTRDTTPPKALGYKAIAVNISDIAAMGGTARYALLSLACPQETPSAYVRELLAGVKEAARKFDIALVGGDTAASPSGIFLNVMVGGDVRRPVLRSGARPGDVVYVTGTLGDAAMGWALLRLERPSSGKAPSLPRGGRTLIRRFHRPEPRVAVGPACEGLASAMIDISDGLIADLTHICKESGASAQVRLPDIPISPAFRQCAARVTGKSGKMALAAALRQYALAGGEDYELLFTTRDHSPIARAIHRLASRTEAPIIAIGHITEAKPSQEAVTVVDVEGKRVRLPRLGYAHFAGS